MQKKSPKFSLPVAAMLIAALSGYLGLPQISLLSRLAPDAVQAARLAHPVLVSALNSRLSRAHAGSDEATQLERQRESGRRALNTLADAPNLAAATPAPVVAQSDAAAGQPPAIGAADAPQALWLAHAVVTHVSKPPPGGFVAPTVSIDLQIAGPRLCRGPPA